MKIVFCDIDGTINDGNHGLNKPSPNTLHAFKNLRQNGHKLFIASGRSKCLLPREIIDLDPDGFILANGSYSEYEGQIIFQNYFDESMISELIRVTDKYEGCYYFENSEKIYTADLNKKLHQDFISTWSVYGPYTDEKLTSDIPINMAMLAFKDQEFSLKAYKELSSDFDIRPHSSQISYDVNLLNTSKGQAIKKILSYLHLDASDAYAYGDGLNDLEMIKTVKYGIAMGNAHEKIKAAAYEVCDGVLDDGVYNSLLKHGLITPRS